METKRNPVLEALQYEAETGTLGFNGIRYMLIRPETVVEIQKVIEEKFGVEAAWEIFYRSGFRGTSLTARKLLNSGLTPEQCLEEMFRMGGHLGWGKFTLRGIVPSSEDKLKVSIITSPFARAYGSSPRPVCAMLCGALAGIFTALKGRPYRCREITCFSTNHPGCTFLLTPGERKPID